MNSSTKFVFFFIFQARIHFPAKKLLEHLFYKIEDIPKWNPTILESKIIRVRVNPSVVIVSLLTNISHRKSTLIPIYRIKQRLALVVA